MCGEVPALSPPNRKVVVSDLHLGPGRLDNGRWHPLEDFRFPDSFQRFLEYIGREGATDLIIAGDFIDFWQILPQLDETRPADWGSSEEESIAKLKVALKAHKSTFAALSRFARTGGNRLILVPGNHDVDLNWPGVQTRLRSELGLELGRRLFFAIPCYRSEGLHVEHGHQHDEANRFANPSTPFVVIRGKKRLQTNWGAVFMSRFYNQLEKTKPFIDNLYPELAAIAWALRNEPPRAFSLPQAGRFAVMLLRDQKALDNLGFFIRTLGPTEQPKHVPPKTIENLLQLYEGADPETALFLRSQLQDKQRRAEAVRSLELLNEEEWRFLQGGIIKQPRTLKTVLRIDPYVQAARKIVVKYPEVQVVVMGHTHEIDRTEVTRLSDVGPQDKWYVNTGCWQKMLSVQEARRLKSWADLDLNDDSIFPIRFSYVLTEYDDQSRPRKAIRSFWTE